MSLNNVSFPLLSRKDMEWSKNQEPSFFYIIIIFIGAL